MSTPTITAPPDTSRPGHKLATLLGSAALVLVLLVVGIALSLRGSGDTGDTAQVVTAAPPAPSGSAGDLTVAPTSRWELYQGIAIPFSAEHGPTTVDGLGPATGYTHDPAGALVAAAQISTRVVFTPNDTYRQIIDTQLVPGPAVDTALAGAPTRTPPGGTVRNQLAGFRLISYTDTTAVFDLAARTRTGVLQTSTTTVAWVGGDWKLALTEQMDTGSTPLTIASLAGYTPWSGV